MSSKATRSALLWRSFSSRCSFRWLPRTRSARQRFFSALPENDAGLKMRTPSLAYDEFVASGVVKHDEAQVEVVQSLDSLFVQLGETDHNSETTAHSFGAATFLPSSALGNLERKFRSWHQIQKHKNVPKGLYIHGGVGVGKSFVMDMFYNCCVASGVTSQRGATRLHFHEFMKMVHLTIHKVKRDKDVMDPLPHVAHIIASESKLLCFDEFQVTDIGDAVVLKGLFENLFDMGVTVVATSNRAPEELYEGGLNRSLFLPFIDFMHERCDVLYLPSKHDYRATCIDQDARRRDVFLHPLGERTTEELLGLFHEIGRNTVGDETLEVVAQPVDLDVGFGRSRKVRNTVGKAAFFQFDELCLEPLSAIDYLCLAKHFDAIVVDNVPALDDNRHNEARRFITLVDTLYEEGTCLFAGCAVPLDRLFEDNNVAVDLLAGGEGSNEANDAVHIDGAGGSSGRSTTMIGEMEWSATGRAGAALAEYSASRDVSFAFERAKSRLTEMASSGYRAKRGVLA